MDLLCSLSGVERILRWAVFSVLLQGRHRILLSDIPGSPVRRSESQFFTL